MTPRFSTFSGKNIYFQGPVAAPGLQQNKKYPGSTYEFRTGTIAQTPLGGIIGEGNSIQEAQKIARELYGRYNEKERSTKDKKYIKNIYL